MRRWRPPTRPESQRLLRVLEALRQRDRQATGQLHREVADAVPDRRDFERLLGGLARAGLVRLSPDTFEKDGRTITFQRAALTPEGRTAGPAEMEAVPLEETTPRPPPRPRGSGSRFRSPRGRRRPGAPPSEPARRSPTGRERPPELVARLRAWRLEEARRRRVPAFRIFGDRTLFALAEARPTSEGALLDVPGLGPKLVERYGEALLKLLASSRPR